jgi:dihydroorotase
MSDSPEMITMRRPDDWHLHLRDGPMLAAVVSHTARRFGRAIIMPNLDPPVVTAADAAAYRQRIQAALPADSRFEPLMTCYLTDDTDPDDVAQGHADGIFAAVKLYPAGATTNSAHGVTDMIRVRPVLARLQEIGLPLLVHGEVVDGEIDVFDREAVYIERVLEPLIADFPALKVVFEHITTADAVDFVRAQGATVAATITAHHLMINRSDLFAGGIRPHLYCLPVAKRERHRLALRSAATSGDPSFFLGTDSAPHPIADKETACGCAGIFTAPTAIELYAQVFAEEGALDNLGAFASVNGPAFYGLPVNEGTLTLVRKPQAVPETILVDGADAVMPFLAGESLDWRLAGD